MMIVTPRLTGIAYIKDLSPKNKLSKNNILLNPFLVSPILLRTANSLFLSAILVEIVLNTEVTPIKVINPIKPYIRILTTRIILLACFIDSLTLV